MGLTGIGGIDQPQSLVQYTGYTKQGLDLAKYCVFIIYYFYLVIYDMK